MKIQLLFVSILLLSATSSFNLVNLEAAQTDELQFPIKIKKSEMVNGVHPDFPWFHYFACPTFIEDQYLELLDYEFQEIPTAGRG